MRILISVIGVSVTWLKFQHYICCEIWGYIGDVVESVVKTKCYVTKTVCEK